MIFVYTFGISGVAIALLIITKKIEEKRKKPFIISKIISKGDVSIRALYHKGVHLYSEGKDNYAFFIKKWVPMRSRNYFNKLVSLLKERRDEYLNRMRDSRLLSRKDDGISEFFKNMSAVEKGGEINDVFEQGSQNAVEEVK